MFLKISSIVHFGHFIFRNAKQYENQTKTKIFLVIFTILFSSTTLAREFKINDWQIETGIETGTQEASFRWSISGSDAQTGTGPNILSELTYQSLDITKQSAFVSIKPKGNWGLYIKTEYGSIGDGFIQDSDYDGNNRTQEYSRSLSNPEGSKVYGLDSLLSYTMFQTPRFQLDSQVGFAWKHQSFRKTEGEQVISSPGRTPRPGSIEGLDSHYKAHWFGPSIGIKPQLTLNNHRFSLRQSIYWSKYYAEANWNLRRDFQHPKSFEHNADGFGSLTRFEYQWLINKNIDVNLSYQWEVWKTKNGTDTLFLSNGSALNTQLNETRWDSEGFSLGFDWNF